MDTGFDLDAADLDPAGLDPANIGKAHRALEPIHSLIYFAPDAEQVLVGAGLRPGRMTYFASRAAPMGAVTAGVVTATFYNFNADLIARFFPRAWTLASPAAIIEARFAAADVAMRRLLGEGVMNSPEVVELGELVKTAASACRLEGRPLFAGHAGLAWPEQPHLALWHGSSLLREHRGDGHVAVLANAGLSGIEALVTHTAGGRGFRVPAAKRLRGWSDEQWATAQRELRGRGLLDDEGALTEQGATLRAGIEVQTDILAREPWVRLGAAGTRRVIELAKPLARLARDNGAFPADVFA